MEKKHLKYSVLMSVYHKEKPDHLRQSMLSILHQTHPTDDFVLICDGKLGEDLDSVIEEMQGLFGDTLHVHRFPENQGLGNALNHGIGYCRNDLVARMDSDDISVPDRCEFQVRTFEKHPELDIMSGTIHEFSESTDKVIGKRVLPLKHSDIVRYSRKRNPFNHPAVMYRKNAVLSAGNYSEKYPLFEDYYLWIRMLQKGALTCNTSKNLVYMRTSLMSARRGGALYAWNMLRFHSWILQCKWSRPIDFITGAIPHACICILPDRLRSIVYELLHR